jgi:hypothetical protein
MVQPGTPMEFLNYLEALLAERYERVGGYVGKGSSGHWQEPLADSELNDATFVIFKRKASKADH